MATYQNEHVESDWNTTKKENKNKGKDKQREKRERRREEQHVE